MKAHSNRGNPAAVNGRKILPAITHGYRVAVLQPFPAHGLTTLFRIFHATSGLIEFLAGFPESGPDFLARRTEIPFDLVPGLFQTGPDFFSDGLYVPVDLPADGSDVAVDLSADILYVPVDLPAGFFETLAQFFPGLPE
ncbi:MAG: hypothetical protein IKT12_03945, partial [Thermoguttaceae bacterium]|nr:hypothetical protein [Thermoguttaceae bacterium]